MKPESEPEQMERMEKMFKSLFPLFTPVHFQLVQK